MAQRGTNKRSSQDQERDVAFWYQGTVSPSSGAAETDAGDVRTKSALIECKTSGSAEDEKRPSLNTILTWLEKLTEEAWDTGRDPILALRIYAKDHRLANNLGQIDLSVRPLRHDAEREVYWNNE